MSSPSAERLRLCLGPGDTLRVPAAPLPEPWWVCAPQEGCIPTRRSGLGASHSRPTVLTFRTVLALKMTFVCSSQVVVMLNTTHFCLAKWREKSL